MPRMQGVITPIVTPFTKDDHIDVAATDVLVDYLIENGISGLYPCGTTGEMLKLTVAERKQFAEVVLGRSANRLPVFVQTGAATLKETIELSRHAVSAGADGIGIVTPQFFGVNERETEEYYVHAAASVPEDFPVYLYCIPQCAGNDISPNVVDRIVARAPNVVGIKYSYPDFLRLDEYLLCNHGHFDVVVGPDRLFLPGLAIGCTGTVSGCSQCDPRPFVKVYECFANGDIEGARKAQRQANELCRIVKAGSNPAYFKYAVELNGLGRTYMRAPALELSSNEKEAFRAAFITYKKTYYQEESL